MKQKRIVLLLTALVLVAAAVAVAVSPAMARYREEITGDMIFQARPVEPLAFAVEQWTANDDGSYTLTFSLNQDVNGCHIYLAVSEGVSNPEALTVTLTVPDHASQLLEGTCEAIPVPSNLNNIFGPGHVFRFYTEFNGEEFPFVAEKYQQFTLTVTGLKSAADANSLLRLFVEQI